MPLPASGQISIGNVAAEFTGDTPGHRISTEFYRGGPLVSALLAENANIPATPGSEMQLSDFYGAQADGTVASQVRTNVGSDTFDYRHGFMNQSAIDLHGIGGITPFGSLDAGAAYITSILGHSIEAFYEFTYVGKGGGYYLELALDGQVAPGVLTDITITRGVDTYVLDEGSAYVVASYNGTHDMTYWRWTSFGTLDVFLSYTTPTDTIHYEVA